MLCAKEEMDMEISQGKQEQKQERQTQIIPLITLISLVISVSFTRVIYELSIFKWEDPTISQKAIFAQDDKLLRYYE
jgi:hypothetical protein